MAAHKPEVDHAFEQADHTFSETYVSQRQTGLPMETRGVVADITDGTLTVWSSTQSPHMVRSTVALMLDMPEPQVRVIHPTIGGGFGTKTHIYPEDIVVPWIARRLDRPARWIEDRMENLVASVHAREQRHDVEVAYDDDGTIRGVRCASMLDMGSGEIFMPGTAPVIRDQCLHHGRLRLPQHAGPHHRCSHQQDTVRRLPGLRDSRGRVRNGADHRPGRPPDRN